MAYILGIDAGTSTVKVAVFDSENGCIASSSVECVEPYLDVKRAEIDMEKYWGACLQCIQTLRTRSKIDLSAVHALSISSQGVTFVTLDSKGKTIGKAILYYDTRAQKEAEDLVERFGNDTLFQVTGQPGISPLFEAAKLLWIRNHEREKFEKIDKVFLVHDYLVYRFTGECATVQSIQSSSLLLDVRSRDWWDQMLDYIGLGREKLPRLLSHGVPVGTVCRAVSGQTGLSSRTIVVSGAIDQVCGMIGIGNSTEGVLSESTGSVLAIHIVSNAPFNEREAGIHTFCNAVPNTYALIGICPTAGAAFNWFREAFGHEEERRAEKSSRDVYDIFSEEAEQIEPGSNGLLMLPHLAGGGSPRPITDARGVFYGIGLHHRKPHFIRALMESVAYLLQRNLDVLRQNQPEIGEIRSFGGGAKSKLWNQIKADVCRLPVLTSSYSETGCLGAAILAGVGSGIFESIEEGCRNMVELNEPLYPCTGEIYEKFYKEFLKLNEIMESMFGYSNYSR